MKDLQARKQTFSLLEATGQCTTMDPQLQLSAYVPGCAWQGAMKRRDTPGPNLALMRP